MRIISGRFGGRRLVSFKADHIRPTTDRVKESIFNRLNAYMDGARVLDLFSGTGNLSCESVSRGAVAVDAVELSRKSIAIIHENLRALGIEGEVRVHNEDVLKYLRKYVGAPYDVILCDPPFTEKLSDAVLEALAASAALGPATVVMIESSAHELVRDEYTGLVRTAEKDYGDKRVTYWEKAAVPGADDGLEASGESKAGGASEVSGEPGSVGEPGSAE